VLLDTRQTRRALSFQENRQHLAVQEYLCHCVKTLFVKKLFIFFKIKFLVFFNRFDALMLKINLKK
jgi:hypothetical protein